MSYDELGDSKGRRFVPEDADLTTVDWLLCIFCSGIACIVGLIRLMQGKPSAGKMIGFSLLFVVLWTLLRFALIASQQQGVGR